MTQFFNCGFASRLFFADKRYMAPNFNFVNALDLNKVLRFEVFVSEDRQLRVVHLILDFKPLFDKFQDVGNAIRMCDPPLARIYVSMPGFLAQEDIVQVKLPSIVLPVKQRL